MEAIPLPAPYGGVNNELPIIAVQSPQCQNLLNFNLVQEGAELRIGDSLFSATLPETDWGVNFRVGFGKYGETNLFAYALDDGANKMFFIDVESESRVHSVAGSTYAYFFPLYFNDYLFFLTNDSAYDPGIYYNGSVWGTIGYTGSGFLPLGGDVFKNRIYIIQSGESAYWYGDIDAITGALIKVSLETIVSEKTTLSSICPITIADNVSAVTFQCFVFSNGEVLFYEGDYPDAPSWRLIGQARIAQPLYYNSFISYQGDSLILNDNGVVSLRDLFLKGSEAAASLTINSNASPVWSKLVKLIRETNLTPTGPINQNIKGIWDQFNRRIIIGFPAYVDENGNDQSGGFFFIYNTDLQAWYFHRSFGLAANGTRLCDVVYYKNKVFLTNEPTTRFFVYEKEGNDEYVDDVAFGSTADYDYEIISAPVSNGRMYVSRVTSMDVIVNSDLHAQTNYYLIGDFGVQTTTAQKINVVSGSIQKTNANIGIEASFVQYKISGTTTAGKTVGYKLYGTNIWTSQGSRTR